MYNYLLLFFKGMAMGIANVIPGVSGGTIALITEIYERLINALKSLDLKALKLLISLDTKVFLKYTDFYFLLAVFGGSVVSVFSIAKLFEHLFNHHPILIWAFFFGLVSASIYYIGKTVSKWNWKNTLFLLTGSAIALAISFLNPSPIENTNYFFIFICGAIGISGMILPGLSGSYILMLMGNYQLLMVTSINSLFDFLKEILKGNFNVLSTEPEMSENLIYFLIFLIGSIAGIIIFSHFIAWIFKRYRDTTLALLTGFVFGSLSIIWPWKEELLNNKLLDGHGEPIVIGYSRYFPEIWTNTDLWGIVCIFLGIISIVLIEYLANISKV